MSEISLYCDYEILQFPVEGWYLEKAINVKPGYYKNGCELEEGDLMLRYLNNPSFIFPSIKPTSEFVIEECLNQAEFHAVVKLTFDIKKQHKCFLTDALALSRYVITFLYTSLYIDT